MPIYEYLCSKCQHTEEKIINYMDSFEKLHCPKCKKKTFTKQFPSNVLLKFKGKGFYVTDYKGEDK